MGEGVFILRYLLGMYFLDFLIQVLQKGVSVKREETKHRISSV